MAVGKENWSHPRYLDREHLTPGDSRYVACASRINQMKGAMDEAQFKDAINQVAASYRNEEPLSTLTLRERIKADLAPDELRTVVLALDATFRGEAFPPDVLDRLNLKSAGAST